MSADLGQSLFPVEITVLTLALAVAVLVWLGQRLRRARPGLRIGTALAVGFAARMVAAVVVDVTAKDVRGPDEGVFLHDARELLESSFTSPESLEALTTTLHVWLFAQEMRIADLPELAMRIPQVTLAVAGLMFLVTAVHDLAGPSAARIAAWLVALEPSSLFYSGLLHKEPFMVLATGIIALGGAQLWHRRDGRALATMAAGGAIAVTARPYAGALLLVGIAGVALHGSLARRGPRQRRSLGTLAVVGIFIVAATPTALEQTSDRRLQESLQPSQRINTSDRSNLRLAPIDYSTRTQVLLNLPRRMRDVVLRPYPWELGSRNQQLGLPGTLAALAAFGLLGAALLRGRGRSLARAGPILYPAAFLFLAFSLSAGNAGTAFRLRSTVIALVICSVVVLRERLREEHQLRLTPDPEAVRPQLALVAPAQPA